MTLTASCLSICGRTCVFVVPSGHGVCVGDIVDVRWPHADWPAVVVSAVTATTIEARVHLQRVCYEEWPGPIRLSRKASRRG